MGKMAATFDCTSCIPTFLQNPCTIQHLHDEVCPGSYLTIQLTGCACDTEGDKCNNIEECLCAVSPTTPHIECHASTCGCSQEYCANMLCQKGAQNDIVEVFWTGDAKQWGLRATRKLAPGQFICEYVGEVLTDCQAKVRRDEYESISNQKYDNYLLSVREWLPTAWFLEHAG